MFVRIMILDNLMPNEKSTEHTTTVHSQQMGQCGQNIRSWENLIRIVNSNDISDPVNIREKLSMIYNFRFSCALMWDIIKIYYEDNKVWIHYFSRCLDINNFEKNLGRMSKYLGIDMRDAVKVCQQILIDEAKGNTAKGNAAINRQIATLSKCFQNKPGETLSLCALVYLPVSGNVLVSRVCPEGKCRLSVTSTCNRQVTIKDVFPILSKHEKDFIKKFDKSIQEPEFDNSYILNWISGRSCCDPIKESFFYQFYDNYRKPMITGPSGTMDLFMIFASYLPLNLYEKQLIVLGIITWMAIPPDHSIFEMLSVLPANDIIDYEPSECEYKYVAELATYLTNNDYSFNKKDYYSNSQSSNSNSQSSNSNSNSYFYNKLNVGGGKPLYLKKLKQNNICKK